jgi:hypothetical protein
MSSATASPSAAWLELGTIDGPDFRLYRPEVIEGVVQEIDSVHSKTINPITQFARMPIPLQKMGQASSATYPLPKTADYAGNGWWQFTTPTITVLNNLQDKYRISYTRNMGHHAVKRATLLANEVPLVGFGPVAMDKLSEINLGAGQYEGYMANIGNVPEALTPAPYLPPIKIKKRMHEFFFNQKNRPAPQDNFPLLACRGNTISYQLELVESLESLIRVQENKALAGAPADWQDIDPRGVNLSTIVTVSGSKGLAMPLPDVWQEIAIVTPDERKAVQAEGFDLVYHTIQSYTGQRVSAGRYRTPFNFGGPIRYLTFAARNQTAVELRDLANYSTVAGDEDAGGDPVKLVTLWYDNNPRIQNMDGDHFSQMETEMHAARVPMKPGIHLLPYCEDTTSSEIDGSVNYSKINTDLELELSEVSSDPNAPAAAACQYTFELNAETMAILRFENKTIEFPQFTGA